MEAIYLSHFYDKNTPTWNNQNDFEIQAGESIDCGACCNTFYFRMKNHTGTHIDLPKHFFNKGTVLNNYPASFWNYKRINLFEIEIPSNKLISIETIKGLPISNDCDLLLLKSGFEQVRTKDEYWKESPCFSPGIGHYLRENFEIKAIGFDFISLGSLLYPQESITSHIDFLGEHLDRDPIVIIEDMKLGELKESPTNVLVSPLLISQADGVPVTIFANL